MLTYREYQASDVDRLVQLADDREVSRYLVYTFPHPYTRESAEWWIAEGVRSGGATTWVIELDGLFVGSVGITPQEGWRSHIAEIGYWIGRDYWGQGLATLALRAMTEHAFGEKGVQKLIAPVLHPNVASMRVLEKCGYTQEGVLRREFEKDGQLFDGHLYTKLADD